MKKQLLLFILALIPLLASAQTKVEIDGIWYNLVSKTKTAEVTNKPNKNYSGSVVIPSKVTYNGSDYSVSSIGKEAFYNCSNLTSVTIPNSVTSIGSSAFSNCSGLNSVHINDLESWCKIQFGNRTYNPLYYAHHLYLNDVEIKDLVIPNSVTSINDNSFYCCTGLTSVTIPNSVTTIGYYAFGGCSSLTSITIPNSVTSIEMWAFTGCSSLTSVTIGNSVTSIGDFAFSNCSSLTSVTIPNSVTYIGGDAFQGCNSLPIEGNIRYADTFVVEVTDKTQPSYKIKEGSRFIGHYVFSGCKDLISITIPNSVTSIGGRAFSGCSSLNSITIPNNVVTLGGYAFQGCTGLTSATIGNSVTTIYSETFIGCTGLTTVTIGNSVASIGEKAFQDCPSLTSITIPNSVTNIDDYAFYKCTSLTSATIGNSVRIIGNYAFTVCTGLTSITIPNSVTSIGGSAFAGCIGLTSVTIGNSVTSIGGDAFYGCKALEDFYSYAERVPKTKYTVFDNSNVKNATLHVPSGTVFAYGTTEPWKNFKKIVELTDTSILPISEEKTEKPAFYSLDGKPQATLQKGLNIVRMSDGTTKKVVVK